MHFEPNVNVVAAHHQHTRLREKVTGSTKTPTVSCDISIFVDKNRQANTHTHTVNTNTDNTQCQKQIKSIERGKIRYCLCLGSNNCHLFVCILPHIHRDSLRLAPASITSNFQCLHCHVRQ